MMESPTLFHLARNKEAKVKDYWVPMINSSEDGAWNVDLRRGLNDWEMEGNDTPCSRGSCAIKAVYGGSYVLELLQEWVLFGQILEGDEMGWGEEGGCLIYFMASQNPLEGDLLPVDGLEIASLLSTSIKGDDSP